MESFHSYEFHKVWGGSYDEANLKVASFFDSHFFDALAPLADACTILRSLLPYFKFAVVTARQHIIADRTRQWLRTHFPGIFEDVLFGNAYGTDGGVKR